MKVSVIAFGNYQFPIEFLQAMVKLANNPNDFCWKVAYGSEFDEEMSDVEFVKRYGRQLKSYYKKEKLRQEDAAGIQQALKDGLMSPFLYKKK